MFDFLGLTTLTILDWTLRYVRKLDPQSTVALETLPLDDAKAYEVFRSGRTTAVFQFESRGMRELLVQAAPRRFEDIVANPRAVMTKLCGQLGISYSDTCLYPSWNGTRLQEVYPWGTIRIPTPEANVATMNLLSDEEKGQIQSLSIVMQRLLGYENFWTATARRPAAAA